MYTFALFIGDQFVGEVRTIERSKGGSYTLTLQLSSDLPVTTYTGAEDETSLRPINEPQSVMVRFDEATLQTLEDPVIVDGVRVQITTTTVLTDDDLSRLQGGV